MPLEKSKTRAKRCDSLVSETLVDFRRRNLKSGKMSVRETNLFPEPMGLQSVPSVLVFPEVCVHL